MERFASREIRAGLIIPKHGIAKLGTRNVSVLSRNSTLKVVLEQAVKSDSHTAPTPLPVIGSFQYREVKVLLLQWSASASMRSPGGL